MLAWGRLWALGRKKSCWKKMFGGDINHVVDTEQKLNILADSSKFDLACSCRMKDEPGRTRGADGNWVYPATLPSGQKVFLLKTLQTNACLNDCSYCPFNQRRDLPRSTLSPDELARKFIQLLDANRVSGLFLSSGVLGSADSTMERMLGTVEIIRRKYKFRGFIHLKVIPGASDAAIERAVNLATRVSVNIEAPSAGHLHKLSVRKRFDEDIIRSMRVIRSLGGAKQTTQFVVGAAGESDRDIVGTTDKLYREIGLERVYYSAWQDLTSESVRPRQKMLFDDMPVKEERGNAPSFVREHRLYQVDFLFRRYGFKRDEIPFGPDGNLSLTDDPKKIWADLHPEFFPVYVNRAEKSELLRVPGLGPISAARILKARQYRKLRVMDDLRYFGVRARQAACYVAF